MICTAMAPHHVDAQRAGPLLHLHEGQGDMAPSIGFHIMKLLSTFLPRGYRTALIVCNRGFTLSTFRVRVLYTLIPACLRLENLVPPANVRRASVLPCVPWPLNARSKHFDSKSLPNSLVLLASFAWSHDNASF